MNALTAFGFKRIYFSRATSRRSSSGRFRWKKGETSALPTFSRPLSPARKKTGERRREALK